MSGLNIRNRMIAISMSHEFLTEINIFFYGHMHTQQ